ncbi:MAG: LytTR family DNA-binding domain-containing protein [Leeuwenhoekiella sp.]
MSDFKISCLIVDDEPIALNLMKSYVDKTPYLELKGICHSALEALRQINNGHVDLIFMDIQMPDLTGIEFSKTLPTSTRVIFTTAFDKYALEGYKVDAIDYLLKPFSYTEFLLASNKALSWFTLLKNNESNTLQNPEKKFIFIKSEYKQLKIELNQILYFEGLKDYIKIFLKDTPKAILTLSSLKAMQQELPSSKFMRVHRSYIVALDKIDEIERSQIIINAKRITVSENYREDFLKYISQNSI